MVRNGRLRARVKIIYCDPVDLLHHLDFAMKVTKPRKPCVFTVVVLSGLSKATLTFPTNRLNCRKPEASSMVSAVAPASFPQVLRLVPWWPPRSRLSHWPLSRRLRGWYPGGFTPLPDFLRTVTWLREQDLPESHENFWTEARLDFIWHTK